ncbi:MAG: DUF885 family protein [Pseudomonadales bacterium]
MRTITFCLLCCWFAGCGRETETASLPAADPAAESVRLTEWLDERYAEELHFFPWRKALYGIKDADYGEVGDFSETALDRVLDWRRQTALALAEQFDYEALTPEAQESYDLWLYLTDKAIAADRYRTNVYLFHQGSPAAQRMLPQLLIAWHQVDNEADVASYVSRIREASRALLQFVDRARLYADRGVHPPYFAFDIVTKETRAIASGAPFDDSGADNPIWADFVSEVDRLREEGVLDANAARAYLEEGRAALLDDWGPAHAALLDWLEDDRPNAPDPAVGAASLPNGAAYYRERLSYNTTTDLSAEQVHEIGLAEVARLHQAFAALQKRVGFDGTRESFFAWLRDDKDDPALYFPNTDEGRQGYLTESTTLLANIETQLPAYFGLLPKAGLVVKRVEPYREQPGAAQHYNLSSPDGSRPGVYYAHLIDMTAMPRWSLEATAYHEGLPGHHLQLAIANELEGVPEFRKRARITAATEGWALYAEGLAKEMPGTYGNPLSEVGRLFNELFRAIRLVVDTGLHAMGWSEQRAVDYLLANSMITEGQARAEVRRYLTDPGQATAYLIGMLKYRELRARAESAMGGDFDLRAFHDLVLGSGPLPLGMLERKVDRWLAGGPAAAPDHR